MSSIITGSNIYTVSMSIPDVSQSIKSVDVSEPVRALANRTTFLSSSLFAISTSLSNSFGNLSSSLSSIAVFFAQPVLGQQVYSGSAPFPYDLTTAGDHLKGSTFWNYQAFTNVSGNLTSGSMAPLYDGIYDCRFNWSVAVRSTAASGSLKFLFKVEDTIQNQIYSVVSMTSGTYNVQNQQLQAYVGLAANQKLRVFVSASELSAGTVSFAIYNAYMSMTKIPYLV